MDIEDSSNDFAVGPDNVGIATVTKRRFAKQTGSSFVSSSFAYSFVLEKDCSNSAAVLLNGL